MEEIIWKYGVMDATNGSCAGKAHYSQQADRHLRVAAGFAKSVSDSPVPMFVSLCSSAPFS